MKRHQDPIQPMISPKNGPNSNGRPFGTPGPSELLSTPPLEPLLRLSSSDSGTANPAPISFTLSDTFTSNRGSSRSSRTFAWQIQPIAQVVSSPK